MEDERIVKVVIGTKVRVTATVNDGREGAQWVEQQIGILHLDPRSVEFGHELGAYGSPRPEVWLEGYVSADVPSVATRLKMPDVMPCATD